MAVFIDDPNFLNDRLDWAILQNGWSSLYCNHGILEADLTWFRSAEFKIIEVHCSDWHNTGSIHRSLKRELSFPDYYGNNLSALNDCLSDMEISGEGLVVVLQDFDMAAQEICILRSPYSQDCNTPPHNNFLIGTEIQQNQNYYSWRGTLPGGKQSIFFRAHSIR